MIRKVFSIQYMRYKNVISSTTEAMKHLLPVILCAFVPFSYEQ